MHYHRACCRPVFLSTLHLLYTFLNWNIAGSVGGNDYLLIVISANNTGFIRQYEECESKGAFFGKEITGDDSITACAVAASPRNACQEISSRPTNHTFECIGGYYAVAVRGNCSFSEKAFRVQSAGFNGVIIYNKEHDNYPVDMASDGSFGPQVVVPVFMVGHDCGISLLKKYFYDKGFAVYIRPYWSYHDLLRYLVPFAAVVGVCFVLILAAMVIKLVRDRRRRNRRRLSKKHLKQIPTKKFAAGSTPDTCPICLDDFQVGDNLRVLPCAHVYHCHCIDPWLLKNQRVCPICKRKVLPKQRGGSNSDSDTDETTTAAAGGPSGAASTPERTPLLNHEERVLTVGNSTFYGVYAIIDGQEAPPAGSPIASSPAAGRAVVLSRSSTPDGQSLDDPVVDVSSRRALLPQSSVQSSADEFAQPGYVTASTSLREGYANPNFIIDPHELDADLADLAARRNSGGERGHNGDVA